MPICGEPLLVRMVERVQYSRLCGKMVVATTTEPADDEIENLCRQYGFDCYRGDSSDLLDRHYQAAMQYPGIDTVIKIPSDCPLIDPAVIDDVISFYLERAADFDFVSNLHPATYPDGNDVEIMPLEVLKQAWEKAEKPMEREHTTPYIWEQPEIFRIGNVFMPGGKDYSMSHRFTIDYQEDYDFISAVYDALYPVNPRFSLDDIMQLLHHRPDIFQINHKFAGVNWYRNHLDELKTINSGQTKKTD